MKHILNLCEQFIVCVSFYYATTLRCLNVHKWFNKYKTDIKSKKVFGLEFEIMEDDWIKTRASFQPLYTTLSRSKKNLGNSSKNRYEILPPASPPPTTPVIMNDNQMLVFHLSGHLWGCGQPASGGIILFVSDSEGSLVCMSIFRLETILTRSSSSQVSQDQQCGQLSYQWHCYVPCF